jgi:glycine/serine hydroxymethyltransferase
MRTIGRLIVRAIETRDDPASQAALAAEVADMVARFPVPGMASE